MGELLEKENKEAYKVFKSAKTTSVAGAVIAGLSGVLLIVGIGQLAASDLGDADEKSGLLIAGLVGVTGGVILAIVANSKFKKAAGIYNQSNSSTGKLNLNFGLTPRRSGVDAVTLNLASFKNTCESEAIHIFSILLVTPF